MAQSPIPGISNSQKMSGSPTLGHQPLSKRDKKRQAVENRITNITDSFAQTREAHSRTQLSAITSDIVSIIRANAYANKPLDDTADEAFSDIISLPSAAGSIDGDVARSLPLGKFGQSFVDDVNDAMEERDARITDVDLRFKSKGQTLRFDYEFVFATAETERESYRRSVRDRLMHQIESKKRQLRKEKEQLDAADYSTLVNNNLTLMAPGSPGGPHTNRKTRNTRRNDYDDPTPDTLGKRKRKGFVDGDNGSPHPAASRSRQDVSSSALWEKVHSSSSSTSGTEVRVENFFNSKEIATQTRNAKEYVARRWAEKQTDLRIDGSAGAVNGMTHDGDDADGMEFDLNPLLVAPAMDRTGSSHATRSTRALQVEATENLLRHEPGSASSIAQRGFDAKDAQQMYGQGVLEALQYRANLKETSKDLEAQGCAGFNSAEREKDLQHLLRYA